MTNGCLTGGRLLQSGDPGTAMPTSLYPSFTRIHSTRALSFLDGGGEGAGLLFEPGSSLFVPVQNAGGSMPAPGADVEHRDLSAGARLHDVRAAAGKCSAVDTAGWAPRLARQKHTRLPGVRIS